MKYDDLTLKSSKKLIGKVVWFFDDVEGRIVTGRVESEEGVFHGSLSLLVNSKDDFYPVADNYFYTSKELIDHLMKNAVNCNDKKRVNFMNEVTLK